MTQNNKRIHHKSIDSHQGGLLGTFERRVGWADDTNGQTGLALLSHSDKTRPVFLTSISTFIQKELALVKASK